MDFESITPEHFQNCLNRHVNKKKSKSLKSIRVVPKNRKAKAKANTNTNTQAEWNPSFLEVLLNSLKGQPTPIDKMTRHPGHIRFMPPPKTSTHILHYDRTMTEWIGGIKKARAQIASFPFTKEHTQLTEVYFRSQQILRRFIERCARHIIIRAIDKQPHDMCDLFTTMPIPPQSLVTVYDISNRAKYTFHTHTAIKTMESSLHYSSYGIAGPLQPKNPYTNVPWSTGQLIGIVQQISTNLLHNHKFPPKFIQDFRNAIYSAKAFYKNNSNSLNVLAATNFFAQKDDAYRDSIYEEILDDIQRDMRLRPNCTTFIMSRKLPAAIMAEWDELVLASFLEVNLSMFTDKYKTLDDINTAFLKLYERTMALRKPRRQVTTIARTGIAHYRYFDSSTEWLSSIYIDVPNESLNETVSNLSIILNETVNEAPSEPISEALSEALSEAPISEPLSEPISEAPSEPLSEAPQEEAPSGRIQSTQPRQRRRIEDQDSKEEE